MAANYFVGIGPAFQAGTLNSTKQLQVDGDIDILHTASAHYQITEQTVLSIDGTDNLFTGIGAGTASGSTSGNTFTGYNAGTVNTANGNSFYGFESGAANNTGIQNVFMGWQTGLVNTSRNTPTYSWATMQATLTLIRAITPTLETQCGLTAWTAGGNTLLGYCDWFQNTNGPTGYGITAVGLRRGPQLTPPEPSMPTLAPTPVSISYRRGATHQTGSYNTYLGNGAGSSIQSH